MGESPTGKLKAQLAPSHHPKWVHKCVSGNEVQYRTEGKGRDREEKGEKGD